MGIRGGLCTLATFAAVTTVATACGSTEGWPIAESPTSIVSTPPGRTTAAESATATPTGPPIGTATMQVSGGTGPVTITYQINGEPAVTETDVTLPWEMEYPVFDKIQSSVTADGGDAELICTIIMDGNLVTFKTEPRPKCSFAYYG